MIFLLAMCACEVVCGAVWGPWGSWLQRNGPLGGVGNVWVREDMHRAVDKKQGSHVQKLVHARGVTTPGSPGRGGTQLQRAQGSLARGHSRLTLHPLRALGSLARGHSRLTVQPP